MGAAIAGERAPREALRYVPRMSARAWLRAARPLAHANIAPPLVLGQALAYALGHGFDPIFAVFAHGFGVLDHLFIVFANDVADREADAQNDAPTPFSGGSRVLQEGLLSPRQLATGAALAGAGLLALSTAAMAFGRPLTPVFALAAIALLAAYSLPPLRLAYRGSGEILQGLGVGLVLPLLGFYLQSGHLAAAPWPVFAPLVVLGFASNILTALPDTKGDRAAGKRTWPVRRTEARARRDALVLLAAGLALVALLTPPLSPLALLSTLIAPIALAAAALLHLRRADSARRAACLRFVLLAAGAIGALHASWSVALFLSR